MALHFAKVPTTFPKVPTTFFDRLVSNLFTIGVWVRSLEPDVDLEGILGKEASLRIVHGQRFVAGLGSRNWKGVVTHVEQEHAVTPLPGQKTESSYFVRISPKAWLLTQRRNYRIYQHLSIPDILDKLLGEWSITPVWRIDRGTYPKLEFKVQYGESDYTFMSRLLEEAGIAFTFPDDRSERPDAQRTRRVCQNQRIGRDDSRDARTYP